MSNIIYIFPGFLFQNGELIRRKTFFINILEPIYLSKIFPKLIHSEMAADFCEIYSIDLSYVITVKSLVEILQNMNFTQRKSCISEEAHIFWEGHKNLQNLHRRFDRYLWPSQNTYMNFHSSWLPKWLYLPTAKLQLPNSFLITLFLEVLPSYPRMEVPLPIPNNCLKTAWQAQWHSATFWWYVIINFRFTDLYFIDYVW